MARPLIVVGNPGNRRTTMLQEARRRLGMPPATIVSYLDLLQGRVRWREITGGEAVLVRLDSPGEHFPVERELIALGAADGGQADELFPLPEFLPMPVISAQAARNLPEQPGRIYYPSQWFRGFCRMLSGLRADLAETAPGARWTNDPREIAVMFDKRRCHRLLSSRGVRVPPAPGEAGSIRGYEQLREAMERTGMRRVFVKLAFGSSASGVLAYQINPSTGAELADTTVGFERHGYERVYYNSRRIRRYRERQIIREIINWLGAQGMHVEQWVQKASHDGRAFDVRQLVVGGEACHRIARLSRTPITNLHLRNERVGLEELGLSAATVQAVAEAGKQVASLFPRSAVAGIDVLLAKGALRPYIVDINPFGDLLLNVRYEGMDTYEWQMTRMLKDE
ncbi:hypothetical protein Elgi_62390 [Paenibacillus elgii]|uniref:STM4014 family protein n=1 Tax=Paenibacillus elgii TaxID=189691 RepID=UPI002D7CEDE2|nr:hypothetical protein Elgi_62390 [Paenibacillus elgii]